VKARIDSDTTSTSHKGLKGFFEILLRRFKALMHLAIMIPVYGVAFLIFGICLVPGISVFRYASELTLTQPAVIQNLAYGVSMAFGFLLYGLSLVFVVPLVNFIVRAKLTPWRGPYYSAEAIKWVLHNALTYMVRYTFLEFITPSPLAILFYQMMGMRVGRGTNINTTCISDPSLISLGNKVTIGGSVTIVAHYGQGGYLIIAPVSIGNGCTIGLKATVMGGVEIGDDAKILPHSVVLPKTIIPARETWGGVPAVKIEPKPLPLSIVKSA
jgi:acetyltransferase-like isoleucine patch superfamily enzyme